MDLRAERVKYTVAVLLYGTIGMFLRLSGTPSDAAAMFRGFLGSVFILVYLRLRGGSIDREAVRRNLKWLLIGGISLGLNWIFLFEAYLRTTVAIASLCNYLAPLIVVLIAPVVLKERTDIRKLPLVAAAFAGIVLVSGFWNGSAGSVSGVLMGIGAAVWFVFIVISNRKISGVSSLDKSAFQLAVSALTILPVVLIKDCGTALFPDLRSLLIIIMLGVLHTGVAYILYFSGMGSLPVHTVAVLGYLEPVVSVLCSVFFLRERMDAAGWVGSVLIIGAAAASELLPDREKQDTG
ncbi:MAG: EamA family transporter [Oscillospiraceae bacterium]|nr:EamA family transporter [Oscillospiraceae bacterium]